MVRAAAGVPVEVAPGDAVEMVLSNWGTMNYREVEKPGLSLRALSQQGVLRRKRPARSLSAQIATGLK